MNQRQANAASKAIHNQIVKNREAAAEGNAMYEDMTREDKPHKYTVKYYDIYLNLHIERIESFKPRHLIESTYYLNHDVESVVDGWVS